MVGKDKNIQQLGKDKNIHCKFLSKEMLDAHNLQSTSTTNKQKQYDMSLCHYNVLYC